MNAITQTNIHNMIYKNCVFIFVSSSFLINELTL